jgi:hypothetical protein
MSIRAKGLNAASAALITASLRWRFPGLVGARIAGVVGSCQGFASSSLSVFLKILPTFDFGRSFLKYTCFGTL